MTMTVTRTADGLMLGSPPGRPERTALLEAAGAILVWDCADDGLPAAIVWDADRALDWAWQVYGPEVTRVLTGGHDAEAGTDAFDPTSGPAAGPARRAARTAWARAWWPASVPEAIPPLDPRIIALERAAALVDVEHLLDDDAAVAASLAAGRHAADQLRADVSVRAGVRPDLDDLLEGVCAAADDRGVAAEAAPTPRRADYALAAGSPQPAGASGRGAAHALAAGSAPLDLSALAPGTVDAAAEARWSVVRDGAHTVLEVQVDRPPAHSAEHDDHAPLEASFAGIGLRLDPDPVRFAGRTPVAATILLTRPDDRTLEISSPGYSLGGGVDAAALVDAARILLDRARGGTGRASSLLAVREAALRS